MVIVSNTRNQEAVQVFVLKDRIQSLPKEPSGSAKLIHKHILKNPGGGLGVT